MNSGTEILNNRSYIIKQYLTRLGVFSKINASCIPELSRSKETTSSIFLHIISERFFTTLTNYIDLWTVPDTAMARRPFL